MYFRGVYMKVLPIQSYNQVKRRANVNSSHIAFEARGVYAGSFDPVTLGHMDVIKRAANMFEDLIVLVAKNPDKKGFLPVEKRLELLSEAIKEANLKNVSVESSSGFTTTFAKSEGADYLVRGLRDAKDFDGEMSLFNINRKLEPKVDTVFLPTAPETSMISSSVVRTIYNMGGDISNFVPKCVNDFLKASK